jgi:hypothetical protein
MPSINFHESDPWSSISKAILGDRGDDEKNYWENIRDS